MKTNFDKKDKCCNFTIINHINFKTMRKFWIFSIISVLALTSCDQLLQDTELTQEEITNGLKTALTVGADSSSTELSQEDGYYANPMLKILLPEEAQPMLKYVSYIDDIAGSGYVEQTIMSINRSAERAAHEAQPILVDAITGITIEDGLNILQGQSDSYAKADFDSTAATQYLRYKTYESLTSLYAPKIDSTLNIVVLNFDNKTAYTTNQLWEKLLIYYNKAVDAAVISVLGFEVLGQTAPKILKDLSLEPKIDQNLTLGQFATGKALDGLFTRVGIEEKKIRKNPFAWASDILQKVFGYVYVEPNGTTEK